MSRSLVRLSCWLQRVMDADERYICAACDDRFAGRTEGIAHVVAHHPEYSAALTPGAKAVVAV